MWKRFVPSVVSEILPIGVLVCISAARAVFLMPTKELIGLSLMVLALISVAISRKWNARKILILRALKICLPVFLLIAYAWALASIQPDTSPSIASFSLWMSTGVGCFVVVYCVSAVIPDRSQKRSLLLLLLLPGIIHLAIYAYDVISTLGNAGFPTAEYIKEAPRVGRKHLSIALSELLILSLVAASSEGTPRYAVLALFLIVLGSVSLTSLDTRGAYFAILVVLLLASALVSIRRPLAGAIVRLSPRPIFSIGFIFVIFAISVQVATQTGYGRWLQLTPSLKKVLVQKEANIHENEGAWWNERYWEAPTSKPRTWSTANCETGDLVGCVDSSTYLRLSWLKYGAAKWWDAPQGIGANQFPLHELLARDLAGNRDAVIFKSDFHSGLLNLAICFGLPGLVLIFCFFFQVLSPAYRLTTGDLGNILIPTVLLATVLCLVRLLVDGLNEGLWYYVMSLSGMLAGFSNRCYEEMHRPA